LNCARISRRARRPQPYSRAWQCATARSLPATLPSIRSYFFTFKDVKETSLLRQCSPLGTIIQNEGGTGIGIRDPGKKTKCWAVLRTWADWPLVLEEMGYFQGIPFKRFKAGFLARNGHTKGQRACGSFIWIEVTKNPHFQAGLGQVTGVINGRGTLDSALFNWPRGPCVLLGPGNFQGDNPGTFFQGALLHLGIPWGVGAKGERQSFSGFFKKPGVNLGAILWDPGPFGRIKVTGDFNPRRGTSGKGVQLRFGTQIGNKRGFGL